jgi:hypothetical protein
MLYGVDSFISLLRKNEYAFYDVEPIVLWRGYHYIPNTNKYWFNGLEPIGLYDVNLMV